MIKNSYKLTVLIDGKEYKYKKISRKETQRFGGFRGFELSKHFDFIEIPQEVKVECDTVCELLEEEKKMRVVSTSVSLHNELQLNHLPYKNCDKLTVVALE